MTRKQALNALIEGHIITHKLLRPTKFMYKVGTKIIDNNGEEITYDSAQLKLLTHTNSLAADGWELVHPSEVKSKMQQTNRQLAIIKSLAVNLVLSVLIWYGLDYVYTALKFDSDSRYLAITASASFLAATTIVDLIKYKNDKV